MFNRKTLAVAVMIIAASAIGSAALFAQMTGTAAVSRVFAVQTADPAVYAAGVAEGQEILTGLGSEATMRVWARFEGEDTGSIVVVTEWPSMSAMAADDELRAGSDEMRGQLAVLSGMRTISSDSVFQEITQ